MLVRASEAAQANTKEDATDTPRPCAHKNGERAGGLVCIALPRAPQSSQLKLETSAAWSALCMPLSSQRHSITRAARQLGHAARAAARAHLRPARLTTGPLRMRMAAGSPPPARPHQTPHPRPVRFMTGPLRMRMAAGVTSTSSSSSMYSSASSRPMRMGSLSGTVLSAPALRMLVAAFRLHTFTCAQARAHHAGCLPPCATQTSSLR